MKETKILNPKIPRRVRFGYPKDVRDRIGSGGKKGEIIDEVWATPAVNRKAFHGKRCVKECWGDYSFSAQLIAWSNGEYQIRLGYYRRRCGENNWKYASQMTITGEPPKLKVLLRKTLAKSSWFLKNPKP